jgi:LysR family transcriptional regulator, benzoate and cis,cis-muconate-responsive activator of ben and cat genes
VIFPGRAERYFSNPGVRYVDIDLPPVATALVRRRADRRRVIGDLEKCSREVAAGLVDALIPRARTAMRAHG